jgi:hypothetical protein
MGRAYLENCGNCRLTKIVRVRIPADLSCTTKARWKKVAIDDCIADIVEALQKAGINMRGSCCGHGRYPGWIHLENEMVLLYTTYAGFLRFQNKFPKYLRRIK